MRPISLAQTAALITFALIPFWIRLPGLPAFVPDLYVLRYAMLLPMLVTIGGWVLAGMPSSPHLPQRILWCGLMFLFAFWVFLSQFWAFLITFPPQSVNYHPEVGTSAALQFAIVALFVIAVANLNLNLEQLGGILLAGFALESAIVIGQAFLQQSIGLDWLGEFDVWPEKPGVSVIVSGEMRWLRPYGTLPHPNNVGGFLVMGMLVAGAFVLSDKSWHRWTGAVLASVGFYALLLTFSRGAWLGLFVSAPVAIGLAWGHIRQSRRDAVFTTMVLILFAGGLFVSLYRPLVISRTAALTGIQPTTEAVDRGNIESIEARSIADRQVFNEYGWRAIREFPVRGVGVGNFPWRASYYLMSSDYDLRANYVHNIYLATWAETGIIGLALKLLVLGTGIIAGVWTQQKHPHPVRAALLAAIVAFAAIGFFDYYTYALLPFQVALWGSLAVAVSQPPSMHNL